MQHAELLTVAALRDAELNEISVTEPQGGDGAEVDIVGSAGEMVEFAFRSKTGAVSVATATVGDGGTATVCYADSSDDATEAASLAAAGAL